MATHVFPALDTNNIFTGQNTEQNNGVFTNTQANEYLTSIIGITGGATPGSNYAAVQGGNFFTTPLDTFLIVPNTAANGLGNHGFVSQVNCGKTGGSGSTAGYFQTLATINGANIWGINPFCAPNVGVSGCRVTGMEIDVGPGGDGVSVTSNIVGIIITGGGAPGNVPALNANAIFVSPQGWSWHYGLNFARQATDTLAILLDGAFATNPTGSQSIGFQSWNGSAQNCIHTISSDNTGVLHIAASGTGAKTLSLDETVSSYLSQPLVGQGIPSQTVSIDLIGQSASIPSGVVSASLPTTGMYRLSWVTSTTQAATVSSTLPGIYFTYTDSDDNNTKTTFPLPTGSTNNSVGTALSGVSVIHAKTGTGVGYVAGNYASSGATTMQYNLHIRMEAL